MDMQAVFSEVNSWPVADRLRLVEQIWDQLVDQGYQPPLTDELKAELDRRCDDLDRNPDSVIPWDDIEARARERFGA